MVRFDGKNNILFDYQSTRNGDHAARFLGDYSGYVVCDGYDAYNKLKKAVRCGCWAHVRRKFVDALPNDKELLPTSAAAKGVEYCNQLFMLERYYSGRNEKDEQIAEPMSSEERHNARQIQSKPVVDAFYAWLDTVEPSGGSNLAKAVQYAKNEKRYLYRFLESGDIPIDNNRAENAIRPMCVGRRNWLFSASVKCGSQCDDVFRGGYCMCERIEGGRVPDRAVPQPSGYIGYAVVNEYLKTVSHFWG